MGFQENFGIDEEIIMQETWWIKPNTMISTFATNHQWKDLISLLLSRWAEAEHKNISDFIKPLNDSLLNTNYCGLCFRETPSMAVKNTFDKMLN